MRNIQKTFLVVLMLALGFAAIPAQSAAERGSPEWCESKRKMANFGDDGLEVVQEKKKQKVGDKVKKTVMSPLAAKHKREYTEYCN